MSLWTLGLVAAITYLSRAVSLVFLPEPSERLRAVLEKVPGPLFAGLAVLALVPEEGGSVSGPVVAAASGALLAAPLRSLPYALVAGLSAYAVARLALGV